MRINDPTTHRLVLTPFPVFLTTIPSIFEGVYGEPVGIAGLNYFALGVGLTGASQLNARMLDRIYKYFKEKNGGVGRPEYRLRESRSLPEPPSPP